ncbi:hypothetical protein BG015_009265 [Linnemannia schmuckeri]|uniref:L-type lectin-like domain-containing protein n=1 Tax=Linnemannia schmuckeri TaxID=64567 RepID=A0A9P5RW91_9FUNG|nr:hypothetical protein BG015_009265 [Linnemannia schmuckeri]
MVFLKKSFALGTIVALFASIGVAQAAKDDDEMLEPLRTHSIYMPYIDNDLQNRWFDFGGDAIVNTNRHIRLTQDVPSQSGWLWSRLPLMAKNFQVDFQFEVDGKGDGIVGDGFAVWFTKERAEQGPVFGNRDRFEGLGIFFDTYANGRHSHSFPYVMAMLGDGRTSYDNDNDGLANRLGGCEADFRRKLVPTHGRITYNSGSKRLHMELQTNAWDEWTTCFTLHDLVLPETYYLGFTSHTGEVHDNHDIISVTTNIIPKSEDYVVHRVNNTPPPKSASGLGTVVKYVVGSGVFVAVVVFAYKAATKRNDMKRF